MLRDTSLAFARAVHLYTAALTVASPAPTVFKNEADDADDADAAYSAPSRSFLHRAVSALLFDPKLLALIPHARLGTVSSLEHLPGYALGLANAVYPLLYNTPIQSEAEYLDAMRNFPLWRVAPCATTPRQTLDALIDKCFGMLASAEKADLLSRTLGESGYAACLDLTHLSRFERREGYADLGVRIFLDGSARVVACDVPADDRSGHSGHRGSSSALVRRTDDLALRRCTTALSTSATIEVHLAQVHFALSDEICTLIHTHLPRDHAVRRLLLPLTNNAFFANEVGVPSLLGTKGVCAWTNFTQGGVLDLAAHAKSKLDPEWLLFGHEGECGSAARHLGLWRTCVRAHVAAFLALHPAIESDAATSAFVRAFASSFPLSHRARRRAGRAGPTLEEICTMALLVPVVHELFSNPWNATLVMNPFTASFVWREKTDCCATPLAEYLPTLAEQIRVNGVASSTMREATRLDSHKWIDRCCVSKKERAAYSAFLRAVAALDIPPDAVLCPSNVSSSVSY
jgi:hypothetical protein